jgi:hypothetical protein
MKEDLSDHTCRGCNQHSGAVIALPHPDIKSRLFRMGVFNEACLGDNYIMDVKANMRSLCLNGWEIGLLDGFPLWNTQTIRRNKRFR